MSIRWRGNSYLISDEMASCTTVPPKPGSKKPRPLANPEKKSGLLGKL